MESAAQTTALIDKILLAVLPLVGVLVGAYLQYRFSRRAESERHERSLRSDAYAAYLRAAGEAETMKSTPDPDRRADILARAISAKALVCVHGSTQVVTALARFEGVGGIGLTPEKRRLFLEFVDAVRRDTGAQGKIDKDTIELILFEREGHRPTSG